MSRCAFDATPLTRSDPGAAKLEAHTLLGRLGDGASGTVYRAVHNTIGRVVAVKMLRRDLARLPVTRNRFFYEARAANAIRNEHIVEIYDLVESGKDVYFVMEYLRGRTLRDVIYRRPQEDISVARAVALLVQAAVALQAAHDRGIIHRDIKPENIFVTSRDSADFVKLFDFGIAKIPDSEGLRTRDGFVVGTAEFMSPEQACNKPLDGRSDVYALACVAYELLSRQPVFPGVTGMEAMVKHAQEAAPPLRDVAQKVPEAICQVVMAALAKSPADRPSTARCFAEALVAAAGGAMSAPSIGRRDTIPDGAMTPPLVLRGRPARLRRWTTAMIAAAAICPLTIAGLAAYSRGHHANEGAPLASPAPPTVADVAAPASQNLTRREPPSAAPRRRRRAPLPQRWDAEVTTLNPFASD